MNDDEPVGDRNSKVNHGLGGICVICLCKGSLW
jgi:hypothetical protein